MTLALALSLAQVACLDASMGNETSELDTGGASGEVEADGA